jgi:hypothetical protein
MAVAATVRHFLMAVCTKGPCAHTSSLNHAMATCSWTFRRHRAKRKRRKCGGGALPARVSIAVRAGRRCRVHQRTVCCHHLSTSQRGPLPLRLRGTRRLQPSKFVALHWRSQQPSVWTQRRFHMAARRTRCRSSDTTLAHASSSCVPTPPCAPSQDAWTRPPKRGARAFVAG